MNKLVIRKGLEANLPQNAPINELFFSEDKGRIYKGMGDNLPLLQFSDVMVFENLSDLELNEGACGKIYIVGNGLYVYNGSNYIVVGGNSSGGNTHEHTNKSVIDRFSVDTDGNLLFDGNKIEPLISWNDIENKPLKVATSILKTPKGISVSYDDSTSESIDIDSNVGSVTIERWW